MGLTIEPKNKSFLVKSKALSTNLPREDQISLRRFNDGGVFGNNVGYAGQHSFNMFYQHVDHVLKSNQYYNRVVEISNPINALSNRLFKKGVSIVLNPIVTKHISEEAKNRLPDKDLLQQYKKLKDFANSANSAERRLEDELRAWYLDLNITDSAYLFMNFNYDYVTYNKSTGLLEGSILTSVERINPLAIYIPLDDAGVMGRKYLSCVKHRTLVERDQTILEKIKKREDLICKDHITKMTDDKNDDKGNQTPESECTLPLLPVTYVYNQRLAGFAVDHLNSVKDIWNDEVGLLPLFSKEVIASHKKDPRGLYGYSVILKLIKKVNIMFGLDQFGENLFINPKNPYAIIEVNNNRAQAAAMKMEMQRQIVESPDEPVWVTGQASNPGRDLITVHPLPDRLNNINYTEYRNAIAKEIAAAFGVTHDFVNAAETVGGAVSQNVQLQVTTEVVESDLRLLQRILDAISRELGSPYYCYKIFPPDDKAETVRMATQSQRVAMVQTLTALGFEIKTDGEEKNIDYASFYVTPGVNRIGQLQLTQTMLEIFRIVAELDGLEDGQLPEDFKSLVAGAQQGLNGGQGGAGLPLIKSEDLLNYIIEKAKKPTERLHSGKTGGLTPDDDYKAPNLEGLTEENPNKSGQKSKLPKINSNGEVVNIEPKLKGDLA